MYFPQMILGVCHKNKTHLPKENISKVYHLWLKWQNLSFKSPLKWFFLGKTIAIKSRFIVFKLTAQITQTQQKIKKWKKNKWGQEIREKASKIPPKWPNGQILTVFLHFSAPFHFFQFFSFLLSLCDPCGHFEYNKPRFYGNFFLKKKSFREGFKTHVLSF